MSFRFSLKILIATMAFLQVIELDLQAQLHWEKTLHEVIAKEGAKEEQTIFAFSNRGDFPITIGRIQASCGCTTASLEKKTYQPGESGELLARFDFGRRQGLQEKSIIVETDDASNPTQVLLFRVQLPDLVRLNKKSLTWEIGDPLEEQRFEVGFPNMVDVEIVKIRTSDSFLHQLKELTSGVKFEVSVTPKSTEYPISGRLCVVFEHSGGEDQTCLNLLIN